MTEGESRSFHSICIRYLIHPLLELGNVVYLHAFSIIYLSKQVQRFLSQGYSATPLSNSPIFPHQVSGSRSVQVSSSVAFHWSASFTPKMGPAMLFCALCAASLVSTRTVWGDYYSLAGRVEKTGTITDTIHTTTTNTTTVVADTTVVTTTTDTTKSTTTTDNLELAIEEIGASFNGIEMAVDGIDTLFVIDIKLSPGATASADEIEEVLRSASSVVSATSNVTAGLASATSTGEPAIAGDLEGAASTLPTIIKDPSGTHVTIAPSIRARGTGVSEAGSTDGGGTRSSLFGTGGTGTGGTKSGGSGVGGAGGAGARSSVTGAGGAGAGGRVTGIRSTETVGTGVGGSGSTGTGGDVTGTRGTGTVSTGTGSAGGAGTGGTRTGDGATTLITITRTSSIAPPTITTRGFGRFGSGLASDILKYPPDRSVLDRCMDSAASCFRAARRGAVPCAQCEALKASCRIPS